jgi:NAD(P)H-hydrate epimerase
MIRLTRAQVREIDRRAIEQYGIPGIVLMENAARAAADAAMGMLAGDAAPSVIIVCGPGNNGGDGLAVARHLHNRGIDDLRIVLMTDPATYKSDAAINWKIVQAMNLPVQRALPEQPPSLYIDAIFGTGLTRAVDASIAAVLETMNRGGAARLAIDIPSGLDCDGGQPTGACFRADRTITFVAEKAGFANPRSREFTGTILVADIGCPRELIDLVHSSP